MKFFNAAMNMVIKAKANAKSEWLLYKGAGIDVDAHELYNKHLGNQMDTFDKALQLCETLQQRLPASNNCFVITIAPKHDIDVIDFVTLCHKFATSTMFIGYVYAFEQKGKSIEDMGSHPHCHFVVSTTYAKSHILRKVRDKFECFCGESGMQVDKAKRPNEFISKYLLEHTGREDSDDAKSLTLGTDTLWRTQLNLQPLYTSINATEIWDFSVDVTKSVNIDTL